jgi:uncharacterized protein YcbK (DUF882 family)
MSIRYLPVIALLLLSACAEMSGMLDTAPPAPEGNARIVLWNKPSGEKIDVTYRHDGKYDSAAMDKINYIFRDRHNGEEHAVDPNLIELIAGLRDRMAMAPDTQIEVLSGYRSSETNNKLARTNRYVAKQSFHMKGQAADIRIPDMNSRALELVAKTVQRGGVALYPDSGHVHVDVGPVRGWEVVPGYEAGLGSLKKKQPSGKGLPRKKSVLSKIKVTPAPSPTASPGEVSAEPLRAKPVYSKPVKKAKKKPPAKKKTVKPAKKKATPAKPVPPEFAPAPVPAAPEPQAAPAAPPPSAPVADAPAPAAAPPAPAPAAPAVSEPAPAAPAQSQPAPSPAPDSVLIPATP